MKYFNQMNRGSLDVPTRIGSAVAYFTEYDLPLLEEAIRINKQVEFQIKLTPGFYLIIPGNKADSKLFYTTWDQLVKNNPSTEYIVDVDVFIELLQG